MIDTNAGNPRACVATVNVVMLIDSEGKISAKVEEWAQSPEHARLLVQAMPGIVKAIKDKIDTASPIVVVPAGTKLD